ncbi:hypothetical protein COY16_03255 [Candidatus Roizmanbacteria bacterium CG_4_10_14_0_2_um_filter_39_13]|uniref:Glycosyltransferase RgtA/B/C/D-like domain-containing protein n=1 Tax=Candidatus Roizmanbacteria bacterium CG_4_10_14_0_2_um_filter_39_13 TaxID=1974825 RepID=A0A2M7TYU7_9BACT|nr:MAG: hypothetical protein COY16_03255 [Candidatus Roizmanbacteria bacterium CG_4_10_14_0_2_um_filter_39_13]
MRLLLNFISKHIYLVILIVFFGFLFFFRLDWMPLNSWDEAWYASIAREIVKHNEWVFLQFNNIPFYDHPPMGFWITASVYKIIGVSEFSTRAPNVIAGLLSTILIYLIGTEIGKNKLVGFCSAIIINTSVWYLLRVRSGNLDAMFLFFYIASIFFAIKTSKNFKYFPFSMLMFACLVMTKTLVGVSAIIPIIWFSVPNVFTAKKNVLYLIVGITIAYIIIMPWYQAQINEYPDFYLHHFIDVGSRNTEFNSIESVAKLNMELPLFYLHMGVRKWYKLWIVGATISAVTSIYMVIEVFIKKKKRSKISNTLNTFKILGIIIWNIVILYPFLTTDQTQIWHLIPVYAPLSILTSLGLVEILPRIFHAICLRIIFINKKFNIDYYRFSQYLMSALIVVIGFWQFKIFYSEVFPSTRYYPDEVNILIQAQKYNFPMLFIDRDYAPIAVFYSGKNITERTREATDNDTIAKIFDQNDSFMLVERNDIVQNYRGEFLLLEKNNSFSILTKPQ